MSEKKVQEKTHRNRHTMGGVGGLALMPTVREMLNNWESRTTQPWVSATLSPATSSAMMARMGAMKTPGTGGPSL